jgi:GrpB-like predicted nucleotidyltransferase (UPF0157 family)
METLEEKIRRVTAEPVAITDYDLRWSAVFEEEKARLLGCLPEELILRIEHFGSTAVPGLCAKPIVDIAIEVADVDLARELIPAVLEPQGCDCFWRPATGDETGPWFTWCIRRDDTGRRLCHLHFVAVGGKEKELRFRDLLRGDRDLAVRYGELKRRLAEDHAGDRVAYTDAKTEFITAAFCG